MNIPPLTAVPRPVKPVPTLATYKFDKVPPRPTVLNQKSRKILDAVRMRRVKMVQERKVSGRPTPESSSEEPVEHILYVWEWFGRKRRKA